MTAKIKDIIGMSIVGGIIFLLVFGLVFFFGGIIMSVLGLQYENLWVLAKFFAIYMILSTSLNLIIGTSFRAIKEIKSLNEIQYIVIYGAIDILINTILIGILEYFIEGIECGIVTALIFSTIIFVFNYYSEKKQ